MRGRLSRASRQAPLGAAGRGGDWLRAQPGGGRREGSVLEPSFQASRTEIQTSGFHSLNAVPSRRRRGVTTCPPRPRRGLLELLRFPENWKKRQFVEPEGCAAVKHAARGRRSSGRGLEGARREGALRATAPA